MAFRRVTKEGGVTVAFMPNDTFVLYNEDDAKWFRAKGCLVTEISVPIHDGNKEPFWRSMWEVKIPLPARK